LGFRVWDLGFGVKGLGFKVSFFRLRVWELGFGVVPVDAADHLVAAHLAAAAAAGSVAV